MFYLTLLYRSIEEVKLYELLAVITNAMTDSQARSNFIGNAIISLSLSIFIIFYIQYCYFIVEQVMADKVRDWTSDITTMAVSSPDNYLNAMGVTSASLSNYDASSVYLFTSPLQAVYDVGRHVQVDNMTGISPFIQIWGLIIPNMFKLISTLHQLYNPEVRDTLVSTYSHLKRIYSMSFQDSIQLAHVMVMFYLLRCYEVEYC